MTLKELKLVKAIPEGDGFLGALASSASKRFNSMHTGIDEWQDIVGQNPAEEGCNCCGSPHHFEWEDDDGTNKYSSVYVTETRMEWY